MQIIIYPLLFLLLYLNIKKKNLICIKVSSNGDSTLTRLSFLMINENFIERFILSWLLGRTLSTHFLFINNP